MSNNYNGSPKSEILDQYKSSFFIIFREINGIKITCMFVKLRILRSRIVILSITINNNSTFFTAIDYFRDKNFQWLNMQVFVENIEDTRFISVLSTKMSLSRHPKHGDLEYRVTIKNTRTKTPTFSLSVSRADVASSNNNILGLRIKARAMAILCF